MDRITRTDSITGEMSEIDNDERDSGRSILGEMSGITIRLLQSSDNYPKLDDLGTDKIPLRKDDNHNDIKKAVRTYAAMVFHLNT